MSAGILSRPHRLNLPSALPFHAAVVTAALPKGCAAPAGPLPLRIGSGVGPNENSAALFALAEAAERYALQYAPGRPLRLDPVWTAGGESEATDILDLTLGAPGRPNASSHGAAAGVRLAEAAERALFEVLEHHNVGEDGQLSGDFLEYDSDNWPTLVPYIKYLKAQFRKLDLSVHVSSYGYVTVRALCCDRDGGRPTMGSAAGRDVSETVKRAAEEAILLWRNMIEIERHGLSVDILETRQKYRIRVYRGAEQLTFNTLGRASSPICAPPRMRTSLIDIVHLVTGRRVRVFDMTTSEVAVPVARVLLG